MKGPIVWFDLETGGVLPSHPDIQIAAIVLDESGQELAHFEEKIDFDVTKADPAALQINHFDPAVWQEKAKAENDVVRAFAQFLRRFPTVEMIARSTGRPYKVAKLAGHHAASFDGPRLQAMFKRHGEFLPADPRVRCTVQRALWWFEETGADPPKDFKLATLAAYFGVPTPDNTHDALVDVRIAAELWARMRTPRPVKTEATAAAKEPAV